MKTKLTFLTAVGISFLIETGCSKTELSKATGPITEMQKKGASEDFPYEIYEPQGEGEIYEQLEAGLIALFDENSTITNVGIAEAVWLWETGVNYMLYPDTATEDDVDFIAEGGYSIERNITLTTDGSTLSAADLKHQIQLTHDDAELEIGTGAMLACLDIQYVKQETGTITFTVKTNWYNFVYGIVGQATVNSATIPKRVGYATICGVTYTQASWKEAQVNVWKSLPKRATATNIVEFNTSRSVTHMKYINGTYLPGNSNALDALHLPPCSPLLCLSISQQNNYAQEIRDQLAAKMNTREFFQVVQYLRIDENTLTNLNTCQWGFQVNLANRINGPLDRVRGPVLF